MLKITVSRSAKINLGNYENTDVGVEVSGEFEDYEAGFYLLSTMAKTKLKDLIDDIELKNVKSKSKADRFGV
jgi:hypothetical protein